MSDSSGGQDPRRTLRDEDIESQPVVGRTVRPLHPAMIAGAFALLAVALFLVLNGMRVTHTASLITPGTSNAAPLPPPPPLEIPRPVPPAPPPVEMPMAAPPVVMEAPAPPPPPPSNTEERLHAPAVVIDLLAGTMPGPAGGANAAQPAAATASAASKGAYEQLSGQAADAAPDQAVATQMTGLGTTITQGTMIPGVLETALNSDLPGYTRAIVSRDVRSFDGKTVLVPRGSRLIGQYRSALSLGQSRVFIIWSRVIRPDGVSIQIGSPGEDALGRGGLTGDVNTHFFARFGSSFLLSVLNGGVAAIAGTPTTQISIGSPAAAAGIAATAAIPQPTDIVPTITVKQGAAINIFVARDLDFSPVKPVKP